MSDNIKIINEETMPEHGTGAVIDELDFSAAIQRAGVDWGTERKLIVCSDCGGQTLYDASQIPACCPFCGSTNVMPSSENKAIMAPGALIPFSIDASEADQCFRNYLKKCRFLPKAVLDCKLENLTGIYLPFWTFDTDTENSYVAEIGYLETDSDGDSSYNYKKFSGKKNQFIDNMIVYASDKIKHPHISKVQEYDFSKLIQYTPEYLAEYPAERYTVGLNDGWERAKTLIDKKLKDDIGHYEMKLNRGNTFRRIDLTTNYYNVKFKYILAPMYLAKYQYGSKTYQAAINGQTGKTLCDRPSNLWKIILFIVLGILSIPVLYMVIVYILHFIALITNT